MVQFIIPRGALLHLSIWDETGLGDYVLGSVNIDFDKLNSMNTGVHWVPLKFEGECVGELSVQLDRQYPAKPVQVDISSPSPFLPSWQACGCILHHSRVCTRRGRVIPLLNHRVRLHRSQSDFFSPPLPRGISSSQSNLSPPLLVLLN
jgi:hypothetical protein